MYVVKDATPNWNRISFYKDDQLGIDDFNQIGKWQSNPTPNWSKRNIFKEDNDNSQVSKKLSVDELVIFEKAINELNFRYSKFNITKTYEDGGSVLLNFASEAAIVLNKDETSRLHDLKCNKVAESNKKFLIELMRMGFFVRKEENENLKFDVIRNRSASPSSNTINITIFPTQECNARCFYCFENDEKKIKMSRETAGQVISYIASSISQNNEIVFRWFGGEPLMAVDIIDYIISELNMKFDKRLKYCSIVTTNGSLLDQNILDKAKNNWHLIKVHLTIDGLEKEHNQRKNYIENINGYQKILENIQLLLENGIYVICRINLDNRNLEQFRRILDELERFSSEEKFFVHATTLHMPESCVKNEYIQYRDFNKVYRLIYSEMLKKGFYRDIKEILPLRMVNNCTASMFDSILINSEGKLFKCTQLIKDEKYSVGDCESGLIANDILSGWIDSSLQSDECSECVFLPICQGGCKYYRSLHRADLVPCTRTKYNISVILDLIYETSGKSPAIS